MAISFPNTTSYSGGFLTSHTVSAFDTSGTNPYLLALAYQDNPDTEVSGVTADTVSMNLIGRSRNASDGVCGEAAYGLVPSDASTNVVGSTPASKELSFIIVNCNGVHQTTPYTGTPVAAGGFGTAATASYTGTSGNTLVVMVTTQNDRTFTASGTTELVDYTATNGVGGCWVGYVTATGSAQTVGATVSSGDNWQVLIFELQPAATGGDLAISKSESVTVSEDSLVTPEGVTITRTISVKDYALPGEGENLITNPGFEANIGSGWAGYTSAGSVVESHDTTVSLVGSGSYKIVAAAAADAGREWDFPALPAGSYYFEAWVKTGADVTGAHAVVRNVTTGFNQIAGTRITTANQDWTKVSGNFTLSGTSNVDVLVGLGSYGATSAGTAWFDNIRITGTPVQVAVVAGDTSLSINKTESVTVSEATTALIPTLHVSKSESITVTESIGRELTISISKNDTATVTESIGRLVTSSIAKSESVTVTESATITTSARLSSTSDTATVSESVSVSIQAVGNYSVAVSDSVTASESVQCDVPVSINKSDSITVTESRSLVIPTLHVGVTDSPTVTDSVLVNIPVAGEIPLAVSDSVTLAESVSLLIPTLHIQKSDNVSVSELVQADVTVGVRVEPGIQQIQGVRIV